ncbi:hypothetical protein KKH23_08575, partial [Patescibacteria group bacterium]|nr:hypothetical protein [Patescibacteria group bacterium]
MKKKIPRILGVGLAVVLVASLMLTMVALPAMAGDRKWTKTNLPAQDANGDWFWDKDIASMEQLGQTIDGVLVAAVTIGTDAFLFQSDDGGITWARIKKYTDKGGAAVIDFAFDPTEADTFYVLDAAGTVWRTNDMGSDFISITSTGLWGDTLNAIDINWVGGNAYLFGGGDFDAYRFDEYEFGTTWQSLGLLDYAFDKFFKFFTGGTGTAEWSIGPVNTSLTAKLTLPGSVSSYAFTKAYLPGLTFGTLANISYSYFIDGAESDHSSQNVNTKTGGFGMQDAYNAPHLCIQVDTTGDGVADGGFVQHDAFALVGTEDAWLVDTIEQGTESWHSSWPADGNKTFAAFQLQYPTAKVLSVSLNLGSSVVKSLSYVDNLIINGLPYDFEAGVNVLDIRTAPDFSDQTNPMVMALYTYNNSTLVDYKFGSGDWGSVVGQATLAAAATGGRFNESFPADFDSDNAGLREYFVALGDGAGGGGVYRVVGNASFNRTAGFPNDYVSVDFAGNVGNGTILAGTDDGAVIRCDDGVGGTFVAMQVQPQGNANVYLQMDEDYLENDLAFALVDGDGQAFNRQVRDRQFLAFSLMDDFADSVNDIAFGSTRFQITTNTGDTSQSLWRKDGDGWARLVYDTSGTTVIDGVETSMEFEDDETVFYWDGTQLFRSTNAGDRFIAQLTATDASITAMVAFDSSTQLVGTAGGTQRTVNNGTVWTTLVTTPASVSSFAVDPVDSDHILAGAPLPGVWESTTQGKTWSALTKGAESVTSAGAVYVAFDPVNSDVFYAAGSDGTLGGVDRWGDDGWVGIYNQPATPPNPASTAFTGLVAAESGCGTVLYVSDTTAVSVLRTLNPAAKAANVAWEQAAAGSPGVLTDLNHVEGSIELFAIGVADVWTFDDTLAYPVEDVSVSGDAATATARVNWSAMDGADNYQVQLADRDDFKTGLVADTAPLTNPGGTSFTFGTLMPGTDYYVRVRVALGSPLLSCWSATVNFQTGMGPSAWNPFVVTGLVAPAPGDKDVNPIQPLFQWNPSDDAASYEFQLADNAAFAAADTKVVKSPAYEWPGDLEYGKTYYWRVRSIKA